MAFCPYCDCPCDEADIDCPECGQILRPEYSQMPPIVSHASGERSDSALRIGPSASDILNQDITRIADMLTEDPDVFNEESEEEYVKKSRNQHKSHKKWRKKNRQEKGKNNDVNKQAKRKRERHPDTTGNSTARWHTWNRIQKGEIKKPKTCPNKTKFCTTDIIGHHPKGASKKHQKDVKFMCRYCHGKLGREGKSPSPGPDKSGNKSSKKK